MEGRDPVLAANPSSIAPRCSSSQSPTSGDGHPGARPSLRNVPPRNTRPAPSSPLARAGGDPLSTPYARGLYPPVRAQSIERSSHVCLTWSPAIQASLAAQSRRSSRGARTSRRPIPQSAPPASQIRATSLATTSPTAGLQDPAPHTPYRTSRIPHPRPAPHHRLPNDSARNPVASTPSRNPRISPSRVSRETSRPRMSNTRRTRTAPTPGGGFPPRCTVRDQSARTRRIMKTSTSSS